MEKENEELSRELQNCKSKQEVEEVELQYLKMIRSWCGLAGNDTSASAEERLEYTLFQDAAITAIKNIVHEFTESDRY